MQNHHIHGRNWLLIFLFLGIYILSNPLIAGPEDKGPMSDEDRIEMQGDFDLGGLVGPQANASDFGAVPADSILDEQGEPRRELFLPFEPGKGDLVASAIAAGAIVLLFPHDEAIRDFADSNQNDLTERVAVFGEFWGSDLSIYAAGGAYILGLVMKNNKIKKTALFYGKAALVAGIVAQGLKRVVHRERPSSDNSAHTWGGPAWHGDDLSFPSGHTIMSFTLATFITELWGHHSKVIPVLAYTAATIGGLSRVHDGAHWLSDVVFGAIIGHLVMKSIFKADSAKSGFVIAPYVNAYGNLMVGMTYRKNYRQLMDCPIKLSNGKCPELLFKDDLEEDSED